MTRLLEGAYAAFDEPRFDQARGCWVLGTTARGGLIGFTPSGEVRCWYPATDVFVSTTVAQFDETVRAVEARRPFYDAASFDDDAHMERLQLDLLTAVARIDPRAAEDGWWNDLLWDILSGDFGAADG